MEFLDILSLGAAYRYAVKIEQNFKHKNKREFGSANLPQKQGKGNQPQNKGQSKDNLPSKNPSKSQANKGNKKTKKDTGKWCKFYKFSWHNIDECHSKQSLVAEIKASESDPDSDFDSEPNVVVNDKGKWIIDAEPSVTIATTQIPPKDLVRTNINQVVHEAISTSLMKAIKRG